MTETEVAVIGGGASGLMASIASALAGADTIILEHMDRVGKKILATGNGKCNYTNEVQGLSCYRGENPAFAVPVFRQFDQKKTVAFFREIGIEPKIKNGYYYPASEQAASVLDVLRMEAAYTGVKEIVSCEIKAIKRQGDFFLIRTGTGDFRAKSIIFATGLFASPKSGSDGSALPYIEHFGHHIIDIVPALVPLQCRQSFFKMLAGIRAEVSIRLYINGAETTRERGELQLTDYGISGIPVFQFSRIVARALSEQKQCQVKIDFLPFFQQVDMEKIKESISKVAYKTVEEFLSGMAHKKIASLICKQAQIKPDVRVGELPAKKVMSCVEALRKFTVTVKAANPFENAQVCSGGIPLKEVTDQLESIYCKNIYITGEILDCDGICGGYNLQWAWATGVLAGRATVQ